MSPTHNLQWHDNPVSTHLILRNKINFFGCLFCEWKENKKPVMLLDFGSQILYVLYMAIQHTILHQVFVTSSAPRATIPLFCFNAHLKAIDHGQNPHYVNQRHFYSLLYRVERVTITAFTITVAATTPTSTFTSTTAPLPLPLSFSLTFIFNIL